MHLAAKTLEGLEEILAQELADIGAKRILPGKRAVEFEGDLEVMYRANLECRTAIRILYSIGRFTVFNERELYDAVKSIDWEYYMKKDETLAVDAVVNSEYFNHSKYAALKSKDAIVDRFREKFGSRPSVDLDHPKLRINVHIRGSFLNISLDSSGDSLHRRGYRSRARQAPISEVLAAGIIKLSGWDKKTALLDPMCGSGTILIEAAKMAQGIPSFTKNKKFGFQQWNNFKSGLWKKVKDNAYHQKEVVLPPIIGADMDLAALQVAEENIDKAGLFHDIKLVHKKFEDLNAPEASGFIITNPPYELRIKTGDIEAFYKMMGDQFKQKFTGWTAWIISANRDALKRVGLRPSRKIPLFNGPLECRLMKFEMYAGTKKVRPPKA